MEISNITGFLKNYDGPQVKLMEVCGTHTACIAKSGIRSLLSPNIRLVSGPGCPVCVTPADYIDKCAEYSLKQDHVLVTFGDMMKVPGTSGSLSGMKGRGARVELVYSPFEAIWKAAENPAATYVLAAVGFETTAPAYGLLIREASEKGLKNLKLLTAVKKVIPALSWICENEKGIDGFICPGHVSVITGIRGYEELSARYGKPFAVAGFEPEHILAAVYDLVSSLHEKKQPEARNLYKSAVKDEGNIKAQAVIAEYFNEGSAVWRGIGVIGNSGLYLKEKYSVFDADTISEGDEKDSGFPPGCRCGDVLLGRIDPNRCPAFGKACNPENPLGPCMVSGEGACGIFYSSDESGK